MSLWYLEDLEYSFFYILLKYVVNYIIIFSIKQ